jgi:hypothetical protein
MVLAEKVATGIPLSKREASRQLELGIRNRDFLVVDTLAENILALLFR